jgi:hypothetical protein
MRPSVPARLCRHFHPAVLAPLLALSVMAPQAGFAYAMSADVTFSWGTSGQERELSDFYVVDNHTYYGAQPGAATLNYYNADFASAANLPACTAFYLTQYGCRNPDVTNPVADAGPGASATGTLLVTDTTLTGTLTVVATSDEGAGPQSGTTAATGYNLRASDGSPFGNVWYGVSTSATLTVNLTGIFTSSSWTIDGGTVAFADPGFQCAHQGVLSILCQPAGNGGGFQANGSMLSWGMSQGDGPGTGVTEIEMRGGSPSPLFLSGVLASLTLDEEGNITTSQAEVRRARGTGACPDYLVANGGDSCGFLTVSDLVVTGTTYKLNPVPVPGAALLFGSALAVLGWFGRPRGT